MTQIGQDVVKSLQGRACTRAHDPRIFGLYFLLFGGFSAGFTSHNPRQSFHVLRRTLAT